MMGKSLKEKRKVYKAEQKRRQDWFNFLLLNVNQGDKVIYSSLLCRFIALDERDFKAIVQFDGLYMGADIMELRVPA